ncbi:MAG TPA: PAS domain S-box protein [Rhodopila sp.]|nr:PAS domain S-box protein [Rhodopila sp.]
MSVLMPKLDAIRASLTGARGDRAARQEAAARGGRGEGVAVLADHPSRAARLEDPRFWLAAIADSSDDAIVGQDLEGRIISWNKAAEVTFGHAAGAIIGQPMTRIIPADRIDEDVAILEQVRRGGEVRQFDTKRQCKDGRIIPIALTVQPIRDTDGRIIGVSTAAHDLIETRRVQRDLERREALLRSILDTVPDALIVMDKQGFIHSFSAAAARLFGHIPAEMIGQNFSQLLPSSDWEQHNTHLAGYAATGERHILGVGQRRDGSTFPMELAIGEVKLPGTRLFTAFVHDLTVQAERERELRTANIELEQMTRHLEAARDIADRSNWAKSHFLAGMSRELRAPLNEMLGHARLLRADGALDVTQNAQVEAILAAGRHLLQMITCVFDLSEVDGEDIEPRATELDARAVAAACLELVRPAAEAKRLALNIVVAPDTRTELVTDPTRLRQVLLNLLGNAVKFTSHGMIEIRLRPSAEPAGLRIEVADTGPGIKAEDRQLLFRDFEPMDSDPGQGFPGAGLGLALSARLASLLGGRLGYDDNPGGGSVFWLDLPAARPLESPPAAPPPTEARAAAPQVLHVLVVDDVAMNRDIAGSFLRAAGHRVTCVEGGAAAIAAVGTVDFDVVLMDVRMPEMDGLEATRRIRALEGPRGRVPIVALTAQAFTEQVAECRKAGMDSHLPKPFGPDSLLTAVLRAASLRPVRSEPQDAGAAPASEPVGAAIGAELAVFNPDVFDRTACYLTPEAVRSYMEAITERGEALLRGLRGPEALRQAGDELAEAAHTIAGSAGMFGFERLTSLGRRFERAIQAGSAEAPALAEGLIASLEVTLQTIHDRAMLATEA